MAEAFRRRYADLARCTFRSPTKIATDWTLPQRANFAEPNAGDRPNSAAYPRNVSTSAGPLANLLVQTAKRLTFDKATNTLSLIGVSPITLFFADRPGRVGNMKTSAFIPCWSHGKDSFAKDPPNADISIVDRDAMRQVVAELQDSALEGEVLRHKMKILQGDMPDKAADVSEFIDMIGMPRTPMSFAGVGPRTYRRAWYW
jgi:hypothetical protein